MNIEWLFENLFWLFFVGVVGTFAWKMLKNGGMRGAMFGSRVERLVGEINGEKQAMHSLKVRIHRLQGAEGRGEIGLELVAKSFASYQMTPVTLSKESALQLAELLRQAANGATATKVL
jgi:hypothetical protein